MATTNRLLRDAALSSNIAAANANATTYSGAIDLGQANAFPINEQFDVVIDVPAIANLANTKTETFTLEHADVNLNANFSTLSGVDTFVVTGGASGSAAILKAYRLPGSSQRFIRTRCDGGSAAGTTITEFATISLRL